MAWRHPTPCPCAHALQKQGRVCACDAYKVWQSGSMRLEQHEPSEYMLLVGGRVRHAKKTFSFFSDTYTCRAPTPYHPPQRAPEATGHVLIRDGS
jgi:hypothetical protein